MLHLPDEGLRASWLHVRRATARPRPGVGRHRQAAAPRESAEPERCEPPRAGTVGRSRVGAAPTRAFFTLDLNDYPLLPATPHYGSEVYLGRSPGSWVAKKCGQSS